LDQVRYIHMCMQKQFDKQRRWLQSSAAIEFPVWFDLEIRLKSWKDTYLKNQKVAVKCTMRIHDKLLFGFPITQFLPDPTMEPVDQNTTTIQQAMEASIKRGSTTYDIVR